MRPVRWLLSRPLEQVIVWVCLLSCTMVVASAVYVANQVRNRQALTNGVRAAVQISCERDVQVALALRKRYVLSIERAPQYVASGLLTPQQAAVTVAQAKDALHDLAVPDCAAEVRRIPRH